MAVPGGESSRPIRVAYLQKAPSGHMNACLQQLVDDGVQVFATVPPPLPDSPFGQRHPPGLAEVFELADLGSTGELLGALRAFRPDVLLVVGWDVEGYRRCSRAMRGETLRVLCTDAQWLGTARQRVGVAISPWYLRPCFDRMFVPGRRQQRFAEKLGYAGKVDVGFYTADVAAFSSPASAIERRAFVFVGRLVPEKGVDVLAEAYLAYRHAVPDPYDLLVAGTGPMYEVLDGLPGVEMQGFVAPPELPAVFARASALVLPSRFEPWGVVVHEATCGGLAVITTSWVGAADDLVVDGVNGTVADRVAVDTLRDGMLWWHGRSPEQRRAATNLSVEVSRRLSPRRWSATVQSMVRAAT
jgi:glycosyltransferase involved in cell wall biosynthesis